MHSAGPFRVVSSVRRPVRGMLAAAVAFGAGASASAGGGSADPRFLVLTDPAITCIGGECGCGLPDLVIELGAAGTVATMPVLNGPALLTALAAGTTVVIPEQAASALVDALGSGELVALRTGIETGGRMLVFGDAADHDARLLNALLPDAATSPLVSTFGQVFHRVASVPAPFAGLDTPLDATLSTYPLGGWAPRDVLFGTEHGAAIALRRSGAGAIGFVASDFSNPNCPDSNTLGAWIPTTLTLANYLADYAAGAPCDLVGHSVDGLDPCADEDGDGIVNGLDRCAFAAGAADAGGCPDEAQLGQLYEIATPAAEMEAFGGTVNGSFRTRQLPRASGPVRVRAWVDAPLLQPNQVVTVTIGSRSIVVPENPGGTYECGWRVTAVEMPAAEFNALLDASGEAVAYSARTTAQTFWGCTFSYYLDFSYAATVIPPAGSDSDLDGIPVEADRCPAAAGIAGNDDNDLAANADDAYPCDPSRVALDAVFPVEAIEAFLSTATSARVDATGMTQPQLCAVADRSAKVVANGITGAFTISRDVLAVQIAAILAKVDPPTAFTGGADVTIDAALMNDDQLRAVAAGIGCVTRIDNLHLTASLAATDIAALVSKVAPEEGTADATGMDGAQLDAVLSSATLVGVVGTVVVDADLGVAAIGRLASALTPGSATLRFLTTGMSAAQLDAVDAVIVAIAAANGGSSPFCDTIDEDGDGFFVDACIDSDTDCNDTMVLFADLDGDGFGSNEPAACGGVQRGDICPDDPLKVTPGYCGCGAPETDADANGVPDCAEGEVLLTLEPFGDPVEGEPFIVRVRNGAAMVPGMEFTGLQLAMYFDAEWLALEDVVPVAGSPLDLEIAQIIDNDAGTLRYAVGLGFTADASGEAGDLVDLVFSVRQGPLCGRASLLGFTAFGPFDTRLASRMPGIDGSALAPVAVDLDNRDLDVVAPEISGIPASVPERPVDIGRAAGAFIASAPSVGAVDACGGELEVALEVIYPGASTTAATWPSDGVFPTGETRLVWTAVDASGNETRIERTVTVGDYQLLDATLVL
ncbi:MAG: hypothetical protein RL136_1137, partial [Planctomycetota bacterium]